MLLGLLITVHVTVCLFLICVILIQQGKSADLAGTFGGQGSQTAFGPRGAANLLTKLTSWAAVLFMVISISLTILAGPLHRLQQHPPPFSTALKTQQSTPAKK